MTIVNGRVSQQLSLALLTGLLSYAAGSTSELRAIELQGEPPALTLEHTAFADKPSDHRSFAQPEISRSDWIQSGSMSTHDANIIIMIQRRSVDRTVRRGIVEELNELASIKSAQVSYRPNFYELTTKYGTLRAVVFNVSADGIRKYCTGFHAPGTGKLYVKGFVCSTNEDEATPQIVACTIDKIRFRRDADEAEAIALGGAAQANNCRASLLDPNAAPAARQTNPLTGI
jgi:hypothetical protein